MGAVDVGIAGEGDEKIEAADELDPNTNGAVLLAVEEVGVAPNTIGVLLVSEEVPGAFSPNVNPVDCDVPNGAVGLGDCQPNMLLELIGAVIVEELETLDPDVELEVNG